MITLEQCRQLQAGLAECTRAELTAAHHFLPAVEPAPEARAAYLNVRGLISVALHLLELADMIRPPEGATELWARHTLEVFEDAAPSLSELYVRTAARGLASAPFYACAVDPCDGTCAAARSGRVLRILHEALGRIEQERGPAAQGSRT